MPTVRVYIAAKNTPVYEPDTGTVESSAMGHMWYEIVDDNGNTRSFGFSPINGSPLGAGRIRETDTIDYGSVLTPGMIEVHAKSISTTEYQALLNFGLDPESYGFDKYYNGLSNSCIDFTWKALEHAGLNTDEFEGALLPLGNIDYLTEKEIAAVCIKEPVHAVDVLQAARDIFWDSLTRGSPLVLDLNEVSGIQLVAQGGTGSVYWDIDQDGYREASGWVASGEGILAIDKNNDGRINDNGELFGNDANFANGFSKLAMYDTNGDGLISSSDTQFDNLIVWIDENSNGFSESLTEK